MKEFELKAETKIEVQTKKKKQVSYQLDGNIAPFNGHKIWEINDETLEVKEAKFQNATAVVFGEKPKKEVVKVKGCSYVGALNQRTALKKFKEGSNGSKPIDKNPLKF